MYRRRPANSGQKRYKAKVIYADVPLVYGMWIAKGQKYLPQAHYDTMTPAELEATGDVVKALADKDCALFFWTAGPSLEDALKIISAWGFEMKTIAFHWVKTTKNATCITLDGKGLHWGQGYHTRANIEIVLLATRGKPERLDDGNVHSVVVAPVGAHSEKPREVRDRIENSMRVLD